MSEAASSDVFVLDGSANQYELTINSISGAYLFKHATYGKFVYTVADQAVMTGVTFDGHFLSNEYLADKIANDSWDSSAYGRTLVLEGNANEYSLTVDEVTQTYIFTHREYGTFEYTVDDRAEMVGINFDDSFHINGKIASAIANDAWDSSAHGQTLVLEGNANEYSLTVDEATQTYIFTHREYGTFEYTADDRAEMVGINFDDSFHTNGKIAGVIARDIWDSSVYDNALVLQGNANEYSLTLDETTQAYIFTHPKHGTFEYTVDDRASMVGIDFDDAFHSDGNLASAIANDAWDSSVFDTATIHQLQGNSNEYLVIPVYNEETLQNLVYTHAVFGSFSVDINSIGFDFYWFADANYSVLELQNSHETWDSSELGKTVTFSGNNNEYQLEKIQDPNSTDEEVAFSEWIFTHREGAVYSVYVREHETVSFDDVTFTAEAINRTVTFAGNASEYELEWINYAEGLFTHSDGTEYTVQLRDDGIFRFDDAAYTRDEIETTFGGPNRAPIIGAVTLADATEDGTYTINEADILAAASDADGDTLSLTSLSVSAGGGALADNGDGTWTYTPAADDDTEVTFAYTVSDGSASASGSTTVDIRPVNDGPVIGSVTLSDITEDVAYTIDEADILAAASDADGDTLSLTSLSVSAGGGALADNGDGTWTYTPAADDDTEATFAYTVSDGTASASGSTTVDILPVADDVATNLTDTLANVSASVSSAWNNDHTNNGAQFVLDGDISTINHTHKYGRSDAWLEVNLGEDALIETIAIENRQDSWSGRSNGAIIEVLDDDVVVWSSIMTGDWSQAFETSGVVGDTVRIENDDHIHLAEIDVLGRAFAPEINLTDVLAATATQSITRDQHSNGREYHADYVLDGDDSTYNQTGIGATDTWLTVDLNADAFIQTIVLENRNDGVDWFQDLELNPAMKDMTVDVLDDGVVVWSSAPLAAEEIATLDTGGVVGDAVRVNGSESDYNGTHFIHLREVDIYGQQNLTDVMAATATQSSNYDDTLYQAGDVLDGDNLTFNHTASSQSGTEWLMINLGDDAFIDTIALENRDGPAWLMNRFNNAYVDVLDDGEVVWSSGALNGSATQIIDTGGVVGDAVLINQGDHHLHLAEVDVFGDLFF